MRFTHYAATIFFLSAAWAVPVDISASSDPNQIDLHARHSQASLQFSGHMRKIKLLPVKPSPKGGVSVKSASAEGEPPAKSTHGGDAASSKVIIRFWTYEEYRELQADGLEEWQHINIHNTLCSDEQKADVEQSIKTFLHQAKSTSGLHVESGPLIFEFQGNCQAQWLPVLNVFNLKVENDNVGVCKDGKCTGLIFLETRRGFLMTQGGSEAFYDTTTQVDDNRLENHLNTFRN